MTALAYLYCSLAVDPLLALGQLAISAFVHWRRGTSPMESQLFPGLAPLRYSTFPGIVMVLAVWATLSCVIYCNA